jgi:hypothetical protein
MPSLKPTLDSSPVRASKLEATFLTDHLALAAFLASCGHQPTLSAARSGKVLFSFPQTGALSDDITAFNDGTAQVEPAAYDAARIRLRKQMDTLLGGGR